MSVTTAYHSQYWAHLLTLRSPIGTIESLSRSIAGARVDLNPHQVDAALFAVRSPLTRGVILADEVGLGKTIEAGLVIAQRWAERRRRILIIVPATLRKQWEQEIETKFYLPAEVLDSKVFNRLAEENPTRPLDIPDQVVICSYHFASAKSAEVRQIPWDLVVIDEAHRLRNVYKKSSKLARNIADAIGDAPKLLLTATPLQNSLMELYGLASIIDPHLFGDAASFRDLFARALSESARNAELRARLNPICVRTLRRQVVEYIPFTRRVPITQDFRPSDAEQELYDGISEYLRRDEIIALPTSQRKLITLVLRKLLASSTFAIADTLERMAHRLEAMDSKLDTLLDDEDLDGIDGLQDELEEADEASQEERGNGPDDSLDPPPVIDREELKAEIADLRRFVEMGRGISANAKGDALIPALEEAFTRAVERGAAKKAVIFTESRRTQRYLFDHLSSNGYEGRIVMMNGSNSDPRSKEIYQEWLSRRRADATGSNERATASRAVDIKAAIVEHFRNSAEIMIATEAAAEGINLQFCSLVVNYDLPWNPQRIEQRIGRCHRYGQKHDVVVVNFLNQRNEADRRTLELLREKFRLFDGVFGASDEVLGVLESGVDIERRIANVYQTCRTTDEIRTAFDTLQAELDDQIQARMHETREVLLEHFDEDVSSRLRVHRDKTVESLGERERWLFDLTRAELNGDAHFETDNPRFRYSGTRAEPGWYNFDWKKAEADGDIFFRQDHPLAASLIAQATARGLAPASLQLDYVGHGQVVSVLKPFVGKAGWLELSKLKVQSFDSEEFLVFSARSDDGTVLDDEICRKLMALPATLGNSPTTAAPDLSPIRDEEVRERLKQVEARNAAFFEEEVQKLDRWSDDLKLGLERDIKDLDRRIREARKTSSLAAALAQKLEAQKMMKSLESERNRKRRELFDAQDAIDSQRDDLITRLEAQLKQTTKCEPVFTVRWELR